MANKTSKKSSAGAFTQKSIENLICQATTDDELEIMKMRVEEAKKQGEDIYRLTGGKLPMVLHLIQENRLKSIKILADLELNLHATDNRNNNALHYCAQKSNEYMSFFIQQGIDIHHRNNIGNQPLAVACSNLSVVNANLDANARISNIKSLLDAGANINDINPVEGHHKGNTALGWALSPLPDMLPVLDFLMRRPELEIHNVNGKNDSALHLAATRGNLEMTQYLMDTGRFDVGQVNDQGLTALGAAHLVWQNRAYHGLEAVIAYLTPIDAAWAEKRDLSLLTAHVMGSKKSLRENRMSGGLGSDSLTNSSNPLQSSDPSTRSESSSPPPPLSKPKSL